MMNDTGWLNYIESRMAVERYTSGNPDLDEKLRGAEEQKGVVNVFETGVIGPCMSSMNYKEKNYTLEFIKEEK